MTRINVGNEKGKMSRGGELFVLVEKKQPVEVFSADVFEAVIRDKGDFVFLDCFCHDFSKVLLQLTLRKNN